jgi:all-trans-retinol dehydrogenase (NAD+)
MTFAIEGTCVLITGSASGMGLLYARRAVSEGARAVLLWDVNAGAVEQARSALAAVAGPASTVHSFVVDVSDSDSLAEAIGRVLADHGAPDVIVNNAGIVRGKLFWEHDVDDDIEATIRINTVAPMLIARGFLPAMIDRRTPARIVNIASAAGIFSIPNMSVYAASKSAVVGWSDSLRLELSQAHFDHIKVTTVAPSYVSTGMFEGARGPLWTPIMTPEYVVGRVWAAMLGGKPLLMLPWTVGLARFVRGVLPTRAWDAMADRVFGIYTSMSQFTGRHSPSGTGQSRD